MRNLVLLVAFLALHGCESDPESPVDGGGLIARGAEWQRGRLELVVDGGGCHDVAFTSLSGGGDMCPDPSHVRIVEVRGDHRVIRCRCEGDGGL